ncbi:nitrogen regulation protein NR(II) [Thermochromatium tepidum]|jgi:PAS domain S-box|uniref:Sensory histidine kinase/phosphatase NtrB n=1 Tax=Thermochromatium tepidum ATCC 43061 TaxID=316276 RepID=A0A6I6E005_THETI|nr:nitrogen regulation protein NR(II) [Thermochromatium tepidum]QGU33291.1 nitrogen regulation protein NR(II) [Thermochromatium tepidum ATCC 43061]
MTTHATKPTLERRILDHLSTSVMLFDAELRLTYLNPSAEVLFEVSARHLLGEPAARLLPCPDADIEERLSKALASGHPFTEREINLLIGDGRTKTVNYTVLPLHPVEAEQELLVELYQVDRQLRITREEQLLSQHQATRALLRGLAHEIKNPLGGLRGAAQLLERELPEAALREYTRIIIDEADRLQALMDRMIGPHHLPPRRALVNIHDVLEHVRTLILAESPQGPLVQRDYDPSLPDLNADRDRLIQALLNLARNAATAAGPHGCLQFKTRVLRQFTIGSRRHKLVLQVQVRDNGPGIPDEICSRIFYPMVSGRPDGTGLGLSIAQELIHQHGGLIACESRPGDTVFHVYLPLEPSCD